MFIQSPTIASATFTDWLPVDYRERPFSAYLRAVFLPTTTLTYNVEYTLDDPNAQPTYLSALTRAGSTITGTTFVAHNLNVGDSVRLFWSGTVMDGLYNIATVPSATTFTVTSGTSGALTGSLQSSMIACRVTAVPSFSAKSAAADGVLNGPVRAVRLNVTAYTAGGVLLEVLQGPASA